MFINIDGGPEAGEGGKKETVPAGEENAPKTPQVSPDAALAETLAKAAELVTDEQKKTEQLGTGPELKKNLTPEQAIRIYDEMVEPARITVDYFKKEEKNYDKNKPALDQAWIAAGGDPGMTKIQGEKALVSNKLFNGPTSNGDDAGLENIYDQLNQRNNADHVDALVQLSKDYHWNKFSENLKTLDERRTAAKKKYDEAKSRKT